jgi:hypothetical protein
MSEVMEPRGKSFPLRKGCVKNGQFTRIDTSTVGYLPVKIPSEFKVSALPNVIARLARNITKARIG